MGTSDRIGRAWAQLYARGRARGGAVDVRDAEAVGLGRRSYQRRVAAEQWLLPFGGGVALLPGASRDASTLAAAVLLRLGDRAVISHGSAAWFHGFWDNPPSVLTVTVPVDRDPAGHDGTLRIVRSRTLLASEVVELDGLRLTCVDRTLRDTADLVSDTRMLELLTVAEQRRLVSLEDLVAQASRPGTAAGSSRFRRMVEVRRRDRWDSALERDTADLCRAHGFLPHEGPFPLRCPDGRTVHLDVAFPQVCFALECDGVAYHSDAASVQTDRRRWRQIRSAGWQLSWVTRADLRDRPDDVIAEVREAHLHRR